MAPFLPWVKTPEELEGKPGKQSTQAPIGQLAQGLAAAPATGMLQSLKSKLPGMGGGGTNGSNGMAMEAQRMFATLSPKLPPGRPMPTQILNTVQGGKIQIGAPTGRWQMIVVYRGKHDPVSRNYLVALGQMLGELQDLGVELVAVSGDPRERAEAFVELLKAASQSKEVPFKIAYGLTLEGMRQWGLYISKPRNDRETDRPFPEPALFVLNTDGKLHIVDYSDSPFSRPDIRILIEGIRYIQENDYPIRGTYGIDNTSEGTY